ncbi:hypothetical protein [Streptomyces sp. NPDC053367]|uniref:hypothetical protein n=1 Tax=Streptomyces sp. NPDC053367 TaxID=3365700 RepID=UPI0037D36834
MGRRAEALAAAEKATDICRRLAADDPAAHEPDLGPFLRITSPTRCRWRRGEVRRGRWWPSCRTGWPGRATA